MRFQIVGEAGGRIPLESGIQRKLSAVSQDFDAWRGRFGVAGQDRRENRGVVLSAFQQTAEREAIDPQDRAVEIVATSREPEPHPLGDLLAATAITD